MKKSQLSLFMIMGVIIVVLIAFFILFMSENSKNSFVKTNVDVFSQASLKTDSEIYIKTCIDDSVKNTIIDTGIREENMDLFRKGTKDKINICVSDLISQLQEKNYDVNLGNIEIDASFYPETIVITVIYPIKITKDKQELNFNYFEYTFDKSSIVRIPGGITQKEIRIVSSDGRAELVIPKGVEIRDSEGKLVEYVGTKVSDVHFDNLENRYVVGELVYENFPDKATFSEPIEFSIEFREEDIPEGYSKENIKIGYWNEEKGIWYAYSTEISGNRATTNITHMSWWADLIGRPYIIINHVFEKRFDPTGASIEEGSTTWFIGGKDENGDDAGTVSLQENYFSDAYIDESLFIYDDNNNIIGLEDEGKTFASDESCLSRDCLDLQGIENVKKRIDNFEDYRETFDASDYILKPNLEYGYYVDPSDSYSEFINCEETMNPNDNPYGIKTTFDGNYPYFHVCSLNAYSEVFCSCVGEELNSLCDSLCEGIKLNDQKIIADDSYCIPTKPTDSNDISVPCRLTELYSQDECELYSDEIFGWHNYQCAGGRVIPGEGATTSTSDFVAFQSKGNAVVAIERVGDSFDVEIPSVIVMAYPPESGARSSYIDLDVWGDLIEDGDWKGSPFSCEILPYSDDSIINEFVLSNNEVSSVAYGIYGVKVIKKTDHPQAKTEIHSRCETYWMFWGEGFYRSNTPYSNVLIDDQVQGIWDKVTSSLDSFIEFLNP